MIVPRWALRIAALVAPRVRSNLAVDAGDILRDRGDWSQAAQCYRRALQICPDRVPIRIQLGHMLKESGEPDQALAAYRAACALPGEDGDALLGLGIMAKRCGHFSEAKAALRRAWQIRPENGAAQSEFLDLLHEPLAVEERTVPVAKALMAAEAVRLKTNTVPGSISVVFDVSDLVSYFRHSRLPTGIQRVQIEVVCAALEIHPGTQIGCFSDMEGTWFRISAAHFQTLCILSGASGNRLEETWIDALEILTATLAEKMEVSFSPGAFLVNLGSSWWLQNYFLHLRRVQNAYGVHYVPFVHDFIPIIAPEHCIKELTQDFLGWAFQIFNHADFFLVNSRSTGSDLDRVAHIFGHDVAESHVAVVPLDADFRRPSLAPASEDQLAQWRLTRGRYALFVSTVESRKNHAIAFQAWRALIDSHGAEAVPDLVCVGNRGWLNDHVYAALDNDPALAAKVRMLSKLSDDHLALLYQNCLFTVYPSIYEGWGLPITESLCYGKIPILTRSSSLPEAGGDFSLYFDKEDLNGIIAAIEKLTFDAIAREILEQRVRDSFIPRTWREVAQQVIDHLGTFAARVGAIPKAVVNPTIEFDRLYQMTRNRSTDLYQEIDEGESFRSGDGWWGPEDWGCATRPGRSEIAFAVPDTINTVRCWLRLRGPKGRRCAVTIECADRTFRCVVPAGLWQWVSFTIGADHGVVRFVAQSDYDVDQSVDTHIRDRRAIGVGVGGFVVTTGPEPLSPRAVRLALEESSAGGKIPTFLRGIFLLLQNRQIASDEFHHVLPLGKTGADDTPEIIHEPSQTIEGKPQF